MCTHLNKEIIMKTKRLIRSVGNSLALTIDKLLQEALQIKAKDYVDIEVSNGRLIITPSDQQKDK